MDEAFLFQLIESVSAALQGLTEQAETIVKSLKRFFSKDFFHTNFIK